MEQAAKAGSVARTAAAREAVAGATQAAVCSWTEPHAQHINE
jgi:hypothetical protein